MKNRSIRILAILLAASASAQDAPDPPRPDKAPEEKPEPAADDPATAKAPGEAPLPKDDAAAVAALEKLKPVMQRDGEGNVTAIDFEFCTIVDADLAQVKGLAHLEVLRMYGTGVGDEALKHLAGLKRLRHVSMGKTKVTNAAPDILAPLSEQLTWLGFSYTALGDAGLEKLKAYKNLKEVYCTGSKVTDQGVKALMEALPELEIIR